MDRPIVIRSIVHLIDSKGWEKEIVYGGDYQGGNVYMVRKRLSLKDCDIRLPLQPCEPSNEFKQVDFKFELQRVDHENIYENYYFKHLYFREF